MISLALKEDGLETIKVNCNPETVSTDYDISDRLYFEPVTLEDVLNIIRVEKPTGIIVQLGGQTPLKLALPLLKAGAPIMNDFCIVSLSDRLTSWESIEGRLKGAALGDFVISIYNPRSKDRNWQIESAFNILFFSP